MHAILQNDPGDRAADPAHLLHAFRGEPDLVSDRPNAACFVLQAYIFALHRIGVMDVGNSDGSSEGAELHAAAVLVHQSFGHLDRVLFRRVCHCGPILHYRSIASSASRN